MTRILLLCLVLAGAGDAASLAQDWLSSPSDEPFVEGIDGAAPPPDEMTADQQDLPSPPNSPAYPQPAETYFFPLDSPLDLNPNVQLRGRIEAEAVMAAQSAQSRATLGDLQNGFGFRRFRLGAQGHIGDSASWIGEVELSGGDVRLRDVFVGLDAVPGVRQIRIGHFREPFSLEGMTSSNFITFLERAPNNILSPARNWGICGYWWPEDERFLFSLGAFRDGTPSDGQSTGDGDNWAYTARLTGLPMYESNGDDFRLVHLGGAFSQRVPPDGVLAFTPGTASNLLTVDDNPGSPFLAEVDIPANDYQLYNLQCGSVYGPFSVQAEWLAAVVQQTNAGQIFVHGTYVYGSYFLTGEHRGYNRTRGSFDQVQVLDPVTRTRTHAGGGLGAVELAGRTAYLDFDSANLPPDVNGNPASTRLLELTLGVNWYLNNNTRIMFNYVAGIPAKVGFDPTVAHIFGVRTAIFW